MGRRLILDTNALIAHERGRSSGLPWTPTSWPSPRCPSLSAGPGSNSLTARGAHDLIIAAHALQTERIVLTFDAKARLGGLPGVSATDP
ncbi:MAG: hypothetical protein ACRDP5_09430 [Streptosporangiaceae bacterium]